MTAVTKEKEEWWRGRRGRTRRPRQVCLWQKSIAAKGDGRSDANDNNSLDE